MNDKREAARMDGPATSKGFSIDCCKNSQFLWLFTSAAYLICYPTGFRAQ